ncbi:KIRREL3 [Branchiostoma lanceolatum]|uniref:KIRREL3 protein n=1 Tax=Branchiostoma lanceolatum TaxID=7740 RepID=A0A8J9V603_BRALA|nr:KIRREL3 [Branchiostoma lanceolatum]
MIRTSIPLNVRSDPCGTRSITSSGASYRVRPESTAVLHGQTAVLRCAFDQISNKEAVVWEGPLATLSYGSNVLHVYDRHRIVGDTARGEYNLEIRETKMEDGGKYKCYTDPMAAADATLTVVVPMPNPPSISGGELTLTAGDQLSLTCRASGGHPAARLTWLNGTDPFQSSGVSSDGDKTLELFLPRLTKWDNGANFTCLADQGFPHLARTKASSRILRVKYPPVVQVPSPSVHVREGEPASLSCMVDSNPKADVTWRKVGEALPSLKIIRDHLLQLPKVSRTDGGLYQCEANNGVPPVGLGSVTLQVYYPPVIEATMEDKVTMLYDQDDPSVQCLAAGNPKPHVRWRRKDTSLYWGNPLRFHRVRYDVQGTYQCVAASDGFREVTKDVFIDVVGKPSIQSDASAVSAAEGSTARLRCEILGDPLPGRVSWSWRNKRGGETVLMATDVGLSIIEKPVDDGTSSTLLLKDVGIAQEGTYVCQASNMFGEARREIRLEVTGSGRPEVALSVSAVAAVLLLLAAICGCWAVRTRRSRRDKRKETPTLSSARSMPPVPKSVKRLGHGTNDSGVEDLELQELDGTLKPRPPPRGDKQWASVGLSYTGLAHAHATTLPPYTTVERHRPDGEDIRSRGGIPEESVLTSDEYISVEAPPPPPKIQRGRWKRATSGGASVRSSLHEAENALNEIQQADSI